RSGRRCPLRACAKITWQNARSGSDQCSIPNAQFLSEQRKASRVRAVLIEAEAIRQSSLFSARTTRNPTSTSAENCALGIEHWSDPGSPLLVAQKVGASPRIS